MAKILIVANPNSPLTRARSIVGQLEDHTIYWMSSPKVSIPGIISDRLQSSSTKYSSVKEIALITKAIFTIMPDIIHVHYARQGLRTPILFFNRIPMIVSTMGGDVLPEQGYRGIHRLLVRRLLDKANYITSKSFFLDCAINRIGNYGKKIRRVTWGINLDQFRPNRNVEYLRKKWELQPDNLIFFDVRSARPLYNKHIILEAFAQYISSGNLSATLLISEFAADTKYLNTLYQLATKLNITDRVRFIGSVSYSEMPDYLALSDVVISIPNSDGLPQSIYEALACGAFPILGDLPQYKGVVEDGVTAKLVSVTDSNDVADALSWIAENREIRNNFYKAGRNYVEKYADQKKESAIVNSLYTELLDQAKGA